MKQNLLIEKYVNMQKKKLHDLDFTLRKKNFPIIKKNNDFIQYLKKTFWDSMKKHKKNIFQSKTSSKQKTLIVEIQIEKKMKETPLKKICKSHQNIEKCGENAR